MNRRHLYLPMINFNHEIDESPKSNKFGLHMHDDFEILCVASGNVGYVVEGRNYVLYPGSVMIMRSAETHKLLVNKDDRYERYIINFRPEMLEKYSFSKDLLKPFTDRALGERNHYQPSVFGSVKPLDLCREMERSLDFLSSEEAIVSFLLPILSLLHSAFLDKEKQAETTRENVGYRLIDYVNAHLYEPLSLTSIAQSVHVSESHLNRVFRNATGTSVYRYILSKRLISAQQLIAQGENAQSVCQKCGFHDYSAFYRLYKKHFGVSPTASKPK